MTGFLEGYNGNGARGFLEGEAPTASEGIGVAINIPGLDEILASEGAQRVAPVMRAILSQESGGNAKIGNSIDGARGIAQVMPGTFKQFAKPGERIDNPADNLRVAARLLNHLHAKAGGDPAKMAAGYFSGEGNIGTDRPFKADHADGNGKRVSSYVSDVLGRMGAAPAPTAETPAAEKPAAAPTPPATWAELAKRPEFREFTPAERDLARAEYFNAYIAPTIDANERRAAKAMFMEEAKALDPKDPTLMDRVSDGLSAVGDAIRNLPDPLRDKKAADEKAARIAKYGVMAELGDQQATGPRFDDLPVTPEYLQAMKAKWNSATPDQRAELATRQDHLGVVARRLNESYANVKSSPALDIIDPRAEARARRLIQNGVRGDLADGLARESARRDMPLGQELGMSRAEATKFDFEARKKYNESPFFKNPLVRGAVKGYEGYKQGSLGLAQFAADVVGADEFAGDMAAGAEKSRDFTEAMGTPTDHLQRNFEGAISSIATQLPALIGGAATGSSALTLSSMFAQTFGTEYSDGRAQGLEATEATQRAGLFAAFEVIGERYGLGEQLKLMRGAATGVETNVLAKFMANTLTKEIPGEALTTTGQFLTDKYGPGALRTEAGMADYLSQMADTVTQTIMQGGVMSAGTAGLSHAARAMKVDPQSRLQAAGERAIAAEIENAANGIQFNGIDSFVREQLDPNRNDVNPADTRKTPLQVWRPRPATPDAFSAGLTPDQQEADSAAQDAFADLLDDEVAASTLLGVEAEPEASTPAQPPKVWRKRDPSAETETQEPASMPVSEGSDIEGGTTAAPAADGKKTKLTPFTHPDLEDVEVRGELAYMADQAGWAQVGGKMIRKDGTDQSSDVTGRTPWIPKQPWYQMMPERLNEEQTIEAVGKALTGQPMTAKEKRVIGNMLDFAKASLEEQRKWQGDAMGAVGAATLEEFEQIGQHADALEAFDADADIPFDLNDPRLTAGDNLTEEQIDGIFGIQQQGGGVSQKPVAGNADENAKGTGAPRGAEPEAFQLESETPEQVKAREQQTEKTKAAERKAKADAEKKAKAEQDAKEQKRRIDKSVDDFQLGESAERAVSGQVDIFDSPAATTATPPKERFGDRNNASVKDINEQTDRETESWGFKPGHFDKSTFSSGRLAPHFEVRDDVALPTINNRLGDTIKLGQGPNGKWGFGLDIYGDVYGPGLKGLHEHLYPDGRTQYDTREEAIDAALQKIKAHGKPGAYEALKAKAAEPSKPKTEKEAKAKKAKAKKAAKPEQEDDGYAQAPSPGDNGIHKDVPNGQWGNVDHPLRFMSGLSRPGDFTSVFAKGAHVGVSVNELSDPTRSGPQIGKAMTEANRFLFVDSGAYSLFQGMKRYNAKVAKGQQVDAKDIPKPLDFDVILDTYGILTREIANQDPNGYANDRVFFVMPDIIGDQIESLKLIHEYGPFIDDMGFNSIVPLQAGELSLTEAYEVMMKYLNRDPNRHPSPVIGIPTSQMAVSDAELTELLRAHGDRIMGVHILGGVSDSKLAPRLAAIRAAGYDGNVSADGAAWRGPLAKPGTSRSDAIDQTIEKLYGNDQAEDLDAMFDEIMAEDAAKPKTEAEAQAQKLVDGLNDDQVRKLAEGLGFNMDHADHKTGQGIRNAVMKRPVKEIKEVLDFDIDAEATRFLEAIEKAIAKGVSNAGLAPSERGGVKGMGERAKKAFESALEAAGWKYDPKAKEWLKNGAMLFLRSQGDLSAPIVQWSADAAKTKATVAAMNGEEDLDAMFDEIMAEDAKPAAKKEVHQQTRAEYREDKESRGKSGGLKAASINLDNETAESLLVNHRSSIPFLGALMGAKGGKNVPKMAADIMRIWKLRDKLAKATVESLTKNYDSAALKALAKEVGGIYTSSGGKQTWAKSIIKWRDEQRTKATERLQDAKHFKAVRAALEKGETVPAAVVKDYPELAAQYFPRGSREYKAGIKSLALAARTAEVGDAAPGIIKSYRDDAAKATGKDAEVATDIADEMEAGIARSKKVNSSPAPKAPTERTVGEAAGSAVVNTAAGFANAILAMGEILGVNAPNKMNIVPLDETKYQRLAPHFEAAIAHFGAAVTDIRDVMRAVINAFKAQFGADAAVMMKPYIVRFVSDYREGKFDEPATGNDSQQDGQDGDYEAPGRDNSVHGGSGGAGSADSQHGGKAGGEQDAGTADGLGVHDSGTASGGAGRRDGVSEPNGEFVAGGRDSESGDSTGGGTAGAGGTAATDGEADGDVSTADGASDVEVERTWAEKVQAQQEAEKIPVKLGDRANIDATLPLLMAAQREDVHFAEQRLAKPTGFGVLFANGTGTGKTYLSLGIIKRLIRTGKKNGVVVVPNQEVMNEWLASAPNLGIELYQLGDKQDKGQGVSITTYANYGDNMKLLDREHDWVVADEAHNLMASKDADVTLSLQMTRAITKHPESAHDRARILHNKLYTNIKTLRDQENRLLDEREQGKAGPGNAMMLTKIAEELRPLLKEWDKAVVEQREVVRSTKPEDRPRLIAVSATPFAWEKNIQWAEGYLFNYDAMPRTGAYNEPSPYQKYMMTHFGWHMKNGKLNEPDAKVNRSLMQIQWNTHMRKSGALSTRMLKVDKDYDRRFVLVDGGIGARIDTALEWLRKTKDGRYSRYHAYANDKFDFLTKSRLLEAIKAKAAIEIIKQHHALGRKVVVFHDFNEGGGFAPFTFPGDPEREINVTLGWGANQKKATYTHGEFLADFAKEFPDLVGDDLGKLKSPIETLREAFPDAMFNNGLEKKKDALQAIKDFNNDEKPKANLLVVQSAKNAGWSGHDKSGKFQRVEINLGLPTAPVKSIQLEGRIYRTGQMSDAIFRYLNTGTNFERFAFATAIATRSETAENLAMGEDARGLKRSFIDAFNESGDYPASADDGRGGKEQDRSTTTLTPFAKAISYYYGRQKKNSRTKAAEGVDYFATPEPLGLKMVEWLEPKAGHDYMEPSAGHGAIARWFPDDVNVKAIEPSGTLAADLTLNMFDPTGVINEHFEAHHIGNKYDGIAMNPPFGTQGKLAMEHVAKAFDHLKEGGRLIAIIPDGPSMEKRLNDWLTGSTTTARGLVKLNVPDAVFQHAIYLPGSTFGRAGTGVRTRIIIIDKVKGGNAGGFLPQSSLPAPVDLHNGDVNDLFKYIEHMTVPPRPKMAAATTADTASAPVASEDGVTMHAHGRVVDDAAQATFKVVGNKLETDAPIAKVTTAAGKELEGVYVPDRDMAKEVDQFTWKPKGQSGYFVRIRHVIRPQGGMTMLSKGANNPANGAAAQAGSGGAVSKADADKIIDRAVRAIGGRVPGVTFEVVDNFHALPDFVQAEALDPKTGKLTTRIYGAYRNGVVYVVLDSHQSKEALQETVFHELYAHAGLAKLFGPDATPKLAELYKQLGEAEGITAIAEKYSIDLSGYWKSALEKDEHGKYRLTPQQMKHVIAEELLAHIAEKGPSFKQTVREFVGMVRAGLRRMGFDKLAARNDTDLAYILRQARRAVGSMNGELRSVRRDGAPTTFFRREESARSVNLNPAVKPKTGLLDTPMRLAMQKTGAHAVWRGAFRLLEKTGDAALNNKVGEVVKAGLIDRYGLSDAVIERHEEMRVKMIAGVRTTERFLDRLQGLSRAEYAVLYAAANNADHAAVADMIKELPEASQTALHEIKSLVRDLGQDAVDLKMLDADTFKVNEFAYLHRSYLKHETDLTEGEKANRATRIKGDQFKQRGLADIVSSERLMKWMPEFWGTRVKNGAVTNGSVGQVFIRLERRDDPRETPSLEGIEGNKALGRLKEVVYWPQGEEIPAKFGDWHVEGEWTLRRTHGKSVVFRRDFTQEERRRMGEIEDIRYAMAKTLNLAVHDVEVGRYFEWLAEGHAKLPEEMGRNDKVIDDPRKAEARLQTFGKDVWVRVPDTKVKGTSVNAYGKLAGRYVPGPVWTDIRAVGDRAFFTSAVGKGYEKLLTMWKISKTALSPAVHVNNVAANVIMADWHDVGGTHLLQAATAWAKRGKDKDAKRLIEDFQDNGGELGTYALSEMQREQLGPILEELLEESRRANGLNGIVNAAGVISLLREGMVRQAAATLGQSKAGRVVAAVPGKMIDIYQLEDQIFRLAAFIKARDSGLSDREAGRFARKSFLDYDIQAPWVVAAKRSGLLPFISFSYRAIPMMYKMLRDKPWKAMKLALVLGAVNAASAAFLGLDGDDEDDERRWLPKEKSGNVLGVIPKMIRMPWNTESGNPVFLDIRRFIPAGDITDTGMSHGVTPLPSFLIIGGPLALMSEWMSNKSSFTGKPITADTDSTGEAAMKWADHVYKWAAPNVPLPSLGTLVPGEEPGQFQTYAWTGIVKASQREPGNFGRDQSVPMAIGSALGVKLEGYSPAVGQRNAVAERDAKLKELRQAEGKAKSQHSQGGLDAVEYRGKMRELREKAHEVRKELNDRATK